MKQLLWVFVVLGACLSLTAGASAAPLFVEDFSYPAGDSLTWHGWICHSGCTALRQYVVSPGLTYTGYPSSGIGNAAVIDTTGQDTHVCFTSQTSGSVYAAFLVNVSKAKTGGDYFVSLGTNAWTTNFYARLFCKRDGSNALAFGLSKYNETAVYTGFNYALNTTYLVVVRYTFNGGTTTDDVVSVWVNPTCDPQPTPQLSFTATTADASGIGGIQLRQGSASSAPKEIVDGVRVATTWADAVCGAPATGACCAADGSCSVLAQAGCVAAAGVYQGDGTNCSPNPCPQLGTCCAVGGACTFVLQANCSGTWTTGGACDPNPCTLPTGSCCAPDGTCTVTTQANCAATWLLDGVCVPNTCAPPTGSCCQWDGTCTVTTQADCAATWTLGGVCVPNTCALPNGSCCYPDGSCAVTPMAACAGTWTMAGVCDPNPCPPPTGACCLAGGICTLGTAGDCAAASGLYLGNATACTPNPCGASLLLEEDFSYTAGTLLTVNGWTNHSGTTNLIPVTPSGLSYAGYPSSAIGNAASMMNTGEDVNRTFPVQTSGSVYYAFLVNVSAATASGDYFTHLGTNGWTTTFMGRVFCRSSAGGVNFGISKLGTGTSVVWSAGEFALNTTHLVVVKYNFVSGLLNDTADLFVNPASCPVEPAPLVTSGVETGTDPSGIGGVGLRQGGSTTGSTQWIDGLRIGTTWSGVVCGAGATGACCAADGSCSVQLQADCMAGGGAYQGDGTNCSPNPCPQLGTCCALDGTCTFGLQANCTGAWVEGGACVPNPCTQPVGSCCALDGTCTLAMQANCAATWTLNGVCEPNTCAQPTGACCYPDGTCAVTMLADCTAGSANWTMFGTCNPNTCPQPTGACCFPTGLCTLGTAADCAAASGLYQGDGTSCSPNPCPAQAKTLCEVAEDDLNGVAVLVGQRVTVQGIALCGGMTWSTTIREFQITDGNCCIDVFGGALLPTVALGDLVQVTGTVANYNGKTELTTPDLTVTVVSSGNPIPAPGATTTGNLAAAGEPFESCLFTIHCASIVSGTWPAAGADANIVIDDGTGPVTMRIDKDTDIDGSPAPTGPFTIIGIGDQYDTTSPYTTGWQIKPRGLTDIVYDCGTGACCFPNGTCLVLSAAACGSQSGTYTGDGTTCDPNNCPLPSGACCAPDGTCQVVTEAQCTGVWTMFGICEPNPCEPPLGSCCYLDGTCAVIMQAPCTGTWTMFGVCNPNPCDQSGVEGEELDSVLGVRAKPNPFAGSVSLRVAGPSGTSARVVIFDAAGRLVRTAFTGTLTGRAFTVTWDGRDDAGRQAATGIYLVRLESGAGTAIGRLVKLR